MRKLEDKMMEKYGWNPSVSYHPYCWMNFPVWVLYQAVTQLEKKKYDRLLAEYSYKLIIMLLYLGSLND